MSSFFSVRRISEITSSVSLTMSVLVRSSIMTLPRGLRMPEAVELPLSSLSLLPDISPVNSAASSPTFAKLMVKNALLMGASSVIDC